MYLLQSNEHILCSYKHAVINKIVLYSSVIFPAGYLDNVRVKWTNYI
jgi:hypothetical protein